MIKIIASLLVSFIFMTAGAVSAEAATMIVRQGKVSGNFYGGASWTTMTTNLNNTFGGSSNITVVADFDSTNLNDYDAVWVDAGNTSETLIATEVSKLQSFAATGKRLFLIGEHNSWATWNNSILSVVGDTFAGAAGSSTFAPTYTHALTENVSLIELPAGGTATGTGGTSLFSTKFALLYGTNLNVFVMLDVNTFSNTYYNSQDNGQFAENVANFFVESSTTTNTTPARTAEVYQHPSTTDTPTCGDSSPSGKPELFEINTANNFATLSFKTVEHGVTGYAFSYGYDEKAENFSDKLDYNGPKWTLDHTIWQLSPNTDYYFKVRALNGCGVGEWGTVMKAKTGGKLSSITQYFPNGSHGKTVAGVSITQTSVLGISTITECDYTIKGGDSLWTIAKAKWGNGSKYPEIINLNSGITESSILQVGSKLILCKQSSS